MIRSRTRQQKRFTRMRRTLHTAVLVFCAVFFMWPVISDKLGMDENAGLTALFRDEATAEADFKNTSLLEGAKTAMNSKMSSQEESDILVLVNKGHSLPADYVPSNLTTVSASTQSASGQQLAAPAAEAFEQLAAAAKEEEHTIKLISGYRSYDTQKKLFENYVLRDGDYASEYSARPGHSEHQTGLAADVSCPAVKYDLVESFGSTEAGIWLADNAHRFGFILRYQEGKEAITGYIYEPWHIRYVGAEAATEMYEKDITLEEYLDSN